MRGSALLGVGENEGRQAARKKQNKTTRQHVDGLVGVSGERRCLAWHVVRDCANNTQCPHNTTTFCKEGRWCTHNVLFTRLLHLLDCSCPIKCQRISDGRAGAFSTSSCTCGGSHISKPSQERSCMAPRARHKSTKNKSKKHREMRSGAHAWACSSHAGHVCVFLRSFRQSRVGHTCTQP